MLRYAITSRLTYDGNPDYRLDSLVREAARWAALGIEYIQLREKDLAAGELVSLTRRVMAAVRATGGETRVLVNSRVDVALAAGADGVHLTSAAGELLPGEVRDLFRLAGQGEALVSTACHSVEEVRRARDLASDMVLFGPVFGKTAAGVEVVPRVGLAGLRAACKAAGSMPVFALGGVTWERAAGCEAAGATGVAGIRLFAE